MTHTLYPPTRVETHLLLAAFDDLGREVWQLLQVAVLGPHGLRAHLQSDRAIGVSDRRISHLITSHHLITASVSKSRSVITLP